MARTENFRAQHASMAEKEAVKQYTQKWATPSAIKEKPQEFIDDTASLSRSLNKRMEQEDNELYKLVDAL